jgi:hypothetical protein
VRPLFVIHIVFILARRIRPERLGLCTHR